MIPLRITEDKAFCLPLDEVKMILRDYQILAVNTLWNAITNEPTALCVMPCGTGKTEVMIALIQKSLAVKPDIKIIVLLNRVALTIQTEHRFLKAISEDKVGAFCASMKRAKAIKPITTATIQSIANIDVGQINMVIIDEAHVINDTDGQYKDFLDRLRLVNPKLKVVGFTATPYRPGGYIYGSDKLFKKIHFSRGLLEMIKKGYLVRPLMKRVDHQYEVSNLKIVAGEYSQKDVDKLVSDDSRVKDQILDAISRIGDRKKIVWACANIKHAEMVRRTLVETIKEDAAIWHSKQTKDESNAAQLSFEKSNTRHLVFVSIVSQGYDYPPIDCVVLMRPIRSATLYVQTVGRGLRLAEDKKDLLVLDYGKVVETVGPLDNPIVVKNKRQAAKEKPLMKFCPNCLEYVDIKATACNICEYIFQKKETDPIKNITMRPDNSSSLFSEAAKIKPRELNAKVKNVFLSKFKSKAGNDCLKITFITDSIFEIQLAKIYAWNSFFKKEAIAILTQLGVNILDNLDDQVQQHIKNIPTRIVYLDDKYSTVVRIEYDK